ncbi:MAG: type II secretion system protein M [Pseudomonadota bacterium]|nr:MAG: type II secretion system protein M [Pseudomonadota bacterium]
MKAWWDGLAPREQQLIAGGAGLLILLMLYVAIWLPLQSSRTSLTEQFEQQRETLRWMQQSAAEIRQLSARTAESTPGNRAVAAGVDRSNSAGAAAVRRRQRVQPDGTHSVRVWLENAAFDDVMRWLGTLEQGPRCGA